MFKSLYTRVVTVRQTLKTSVKDQIAIPLFYNTSLAFGSASLFCNTKIYELLWSYIPAFLE